MKLNYLGCLFRSKKIGLAILLIGSVAFAQSYVEELNVVGQAIYSFTATENDTHAATMSVNAAGFGDVKAFEVMYSTGAVSAGETEAAILIDIDETAATGGSLCAMQVSSTSQGSADTITGMALGVGVGAVIQQSGAIVNVEQAFTYDDSGASFADVTAAFNSGGTDVSLFVEDDDVVYIGMAVQFTTVEVVLDTGASGSGITPVFEFSAGGSSWTAFSPVDGTNAFQSTGTITWQLGDVPTWATDTVNAVGSKYWFRITRTKNSLSTVPIEDTIQVASPTVYQWDKEGVIDIASLIMGEVSTPSEPPAGDCALYFKTDSLLYKFCEGAAETRVGGGSGASGVENLGLLPSVGGSALTIDIVKADGTTALDGTTHITFRSETDASGALVTESLSTDIDIVIPSTATLGCENGGNCYYWIYAYWVSAGVVEACIIGQWLDESQLHNSTAIGTGSDAGNVLYCDSTSTSQPIKLIGRIKYDAAPNGTYAGVPDDVAINTDGAALRDTQFRLDVNIGGASPTLGVTAQTSYTGIVDGGLDMVLLLNNAGTTQIPCNTAASNGLTCSATTEYIGVIFDAIGGTGIYEFCFYFTHEIQNAAAERLSATFEIHEIANEGSNTTLQVAGTRIFFDHSELGITGVPVSLCGRLTFTDPGEKGILLKYEQSVTGTPTASNIIADRDANNGLRDIRITGRKIF